MDPDELYRLFVNPVLFSEKFSNVTVAGRQE